MKYDPRSFLPMQGAARAYLPDTAERVRRFVPMVRRLAEENGAAIEIDSAPGKGTVVLVSFARA